jgi:hypothetical protein
MLKHEVDVIPVPGGRWQPRNAIRRSVNTIMTTTATVMLFRTPGQQFIYHETLFVFLQAKDRMYEELIGLIEDMHEATFSSTNP